MQRQVFLGLQGSLEHHTSEFLRKIADGRH